MLLVQDALPIGDDWLEILVRPFTNDPMLAATFARQRARSDASALTRHYLDGWIASSAEGWRADLEGGKTQFDAMTPAERLRRCTFDNVASCIRRSAWEKHPFKATPIAEDLEWAKEVLLDGYALRFVPDAVVEHSHDRSAAYEYARTRLLHARLYDLFGLQTIPTSPALARAMLSSMARHLMVEWRNPSQWPRAAALAVAWPLGQYRGARLARSGDVRPPVRVPAKLNTEGTESDARPDRCPRLPSQCLRRSGVVCAGARRRARGRGDDVLVLTREADRSRGEFAVRREQREGMEIAWINNTFASVRSFADTYTDDRIDRDRRGPDR